MGIQVSNIYFADFDKQQAEEFNQKMAHAVAPETNEAEAFEQFATLLDYYVEHTRLNIAFDRSEYADDGLDVGFINHKGNYQAITDVYSTLRENLDEVKIELEFDALGFKAMFLRSEPATKWVPRLLRAIMASNKIVMTMKNDVFNPANVTTKQSDDPEYDKAYTKARNDFLTFMFEDAFEQASTIVMHDGVVSDEKEPELHFSYFNSAELTIKYAVDKHGVLSFEVYDQYGLIARPSFSRAPVYQMDEPEMRNEIRAVVVAINHVNASIRRYEVMSNDEIVQTYINDLTRETMDDTYIPRSVLRAIAHEVKSKLYENVLGSFVTDDGDIPNVEIAMSRDLDSDILTIKISNLDFSDLPIEVIAHLTTISGTARPFKVGISQNNSQTGRSSRVSRSLTLIETITNAVDEQTNLARKDHDYKKTESLRIKSQNEALSARQNVIIIGSLVTRERVALTVPFQLFDVLNELQVSVETLVEHTTDDMVEVAKKFGTIVDN